MKDFHFLPVPCCHFSRGFGGPTEWQYHQSNLLGDGQHQVAATVEEGRGLGEVCPISPSLLSQSPSFPSTFPLFLSSLPSLSSFSPSPPLSLPTSLLPHPSPSLFPSSLCLLESTIENFMIKRERSSPESSGPNISTTGYTLGFSHRNTMTVAVVSLMASSFAFFVIYVYKYIIFYPGKKKQKQNWRTHWRKDIWFWLDSLQINCHQFL